MAIWLHSLSKPSFRAYVSIVKHRENKDDINFDTATFENSDRGILVVTVEKFIDEYFVNLNKNDYSVSVRIDSCINYDLQV